MVVLFRSFSFSPAGKSCPPPPKKKSRISMIGVLLTAIFSFFLCRRRCGSSRVELENGAWAVRGEGTTSEMREGLKD